tara:strand:- start:14 stop:574 length:561 start_codon:yes stop_codon:yes gene_type:complete
MKESTTTFDESADGFVPSPPGLYPAHVIAAESREYSGSKVFNFTFKVADEVSKMMVPKMIADGNGWYKASEETISGKFLAGRKFFSKGIWFTPNPASDEKWRNRNYKTFCENLGVVFEKSKDDNNVILLCEIEESDVLGFPCLVKVAENSYEKNGETVRNMKVSSVFTWNDGTALSPDELTSDVPF